LKARERLSQYIRSPRWANCYGERIQAQRTAIRRHGFRTATRAQPWAGFARLEREHARFHRGQAPTFWRDFVRFVGYPIGRIQTHRAGLWGTMLLEPQNFPKDAESSIKSLGSTFQSGNIGFNKVRSSIRMAQDNIASNERIGTDSPRECPRPSSPTRVVV